MDTMDKTQSIQSIKSIKSIKSTHASYSELAAKAALVLIGVACALLDRQIDTLAVDFTQKGGFTERLYHVRTEWRDQRPN